MIFLKVWIGYTVLGVSLFSAILIWAIRAHQFTDMERGRSIPLRTFEPADQSSETDEPSVVDRYTWAFLAGLCIAVVISALGVGWRLH